jgi:hypothetical protein
MGPVGVAEVEEELLDDTLEDTTADEEEDADDLFCTVAKVVPTKIDLLV